MSLRKICREIVLEVVLRRALAVEEEEDSGRLQVVVDEATLRNLNSFLRMSDLHAEGVTSMELVERQREPLPGLDVLYLLRPESANIESLLNDYRTEGAPQHRYVHLAFTQPLSAQLMGKLAEAKCLAPRVKSMVEVPLSFVVLQDRGFHFDMPDALPGLFPTADSGLVSSIAGRLADACRCLQVNTPTIRHAPLESCRSIAMQVQEQLSVFRLPRDGQVPCQLLIVNRSVDLAAVLVHEYTYEAAAYDLLDGNTLDIDRHVVVMLGPPKREVLLSDADPLWEELRHTHITEVRRVLDRKLESFRGQQEMRGGQSPSASELLEMLRKTPEMREAGDRLTLHYTLLDKLFRRLEEERATSGIGLIEQDIACGIDASGKDVKALNLQNNLTRLFSETDCPMSSESKLRLLMLYFTCMANVSEVVRSRLIEMAKLEPDDQEVLQNMLRTKLMDVPDSQRHKLGTNCVHRVTKDQADRFKRNARGNGRFELSRFEPRVKALVEQAASNRLADADFPLLNGDDAGESAQPLRMAGMGGAAVPGAPAMDSWSFAGWPGANGAVAAKAAESSDVTQRIVIFVLGGITHSELRAASEVAQSLPRGTEVLIGGTALLTPRRLIQALKPRAGGASFSPKRNSDGLDLA